MDKFSIPAEALEAGKRAAAIELYRLVEPDTRATELTEDEIAAVARAAAEALIQNWPRMEEGFFGKNNEDFVHGIILPLTEQGHE